MKEKEKTGKKKELTGQQHLAIELIIAGKSDREVAEATNSSRETICRWRNHNFLFISELNLKRQELWYSANERLRAMVHRALDVLEKNLEAGNDVKTAIEVLKSANLYGNMEPPSSDTNSDIILLKRAAEMAQQAFNAKICPGKSQTERQLAESFARQFMNDQEEQDPQ
jgi:hypothetical protein